MPAAPFTAVLLAGGKSTRMGRDKAFIEIDGVPLWQRQLKILEQLRPRDILIAGPPFPEWIATGYALLPDAKKNAGPLGGLVASLRRCATPLLVALAVDLPHMTTDHLARLLSRSSSEKGLVPKIQDRFQPLAAVYPAEALPLAENCLQSGDYSLRGFVRHCLAAGLIEVETDSEVAPLFFNLNTSADLARLRPAIAR